MAKFILGLILVWGLTGFGGFIGFDEWKTYGVACVCGWGFLFCDWVR